MHVRCRPGEKPEIISKAYLSASLAAIAVCDQAGANRPFIRKALSTFQAPGRVELLKSAARYGRTVLVDFAHNRLSMSSLLKALKKYRPGKLVCVFGMRWDETLLRRYDMGKAAGEFADLSIITTDYVGPVSFEEINKDIIKGLRDSAGEYIVIQDRKEAIEHALEITGEEDIVVIVGMGDLQVQKIFDKEVYFSEKEIVENYLKRQLERDKKGTGYETQGFNPKEEL